MRKIQLFLRLPNGQDSPLAGGRWRCPGSMRAGSLSLGGHPQTRRHFAFHGPDHMASNEAGNLARGPLHGRRARLRPSTPGTSFLAQKQEGVPKSGFPDKSRVRPFRRRTRSAHSPHIGWPFKLASLASKGSGAARMGGSESRVEECLARDGGDTAFAVEPLHSDRE
jgi:hypothetical protein